MYGRNVRLGVWCYWFRFFKECCYDGWVCNSSSGEKDEKKRILKNERRRIIKNEKRRIIKMERKITTKKERRTKIIVSQT